MITYVLYPWIKKGYILIRCVSIGWIRYIATTLNSDDEDDLNPRATFNMDEPKVIGLDPGSGEKVGCFFL